MMTQAVDLDNPILGFTHQWINELANHFEHIHVVSRLAGRTNLAQNVTVHAYASSTQKDIPLQRHFFFNRKLFSLILGNQVDTVFIHMIPKWVIMAHRISRFKRIPISLWYTHVAPDPVLKKAHQLVRHGLTAVKESYHFADKKVSALGHGIDTAMFVPPAIREKSGVFRILLVGRLSPIKKVDLLIEAISELKDNLPLTCQIIGAPANKEDHVYQQELHSLIRANQLENSVQLMGAIPFSEIYFHYQNSDLMINLTAANSFDKTVLEAMATELPVITSNPSFFPMLENFNPSLMLKTVNKHQLAQQICNIAALPNKEAEQLQKGLRQEVVQHHDIKKLMAKIATLLKDK